MKMELMCCESTLLSEIAMPEIKRKHLAMTYALAMRSSDKNIDWAKVNKAIMERWSFSGLKYIKEMAHSGKCFDEKVVSMREYSDEAVTKAEIRRCAKRYDKDDMTGSIYNPKKSNLTH